MSIFLNIHDILKDICTRHTNTCRLFFEKIFNFLLKEFSVKEKKKRLRQDWCGAQEKARNRPLSHFSDRDTEALRCQVIFPGSHSRGLNADLLTLSLVLSPLLCALGTELANRAIK